MLVLAVLRLVMVRQPFADGIGVPVRHGQPRPIVDAPYPLDQDFIPPIKDVIKRLNDRDDIEVVTNPMSTQVRGSYNFV